MENFSITDPLPTGTVLLEASAGTGKTWTIAALVTRFVAEGEVDSLQQMLVVTFSRAASQELRARVREQLVVAERAVGQELASRTGAEPVGEPVEPDVLVDLLLDGDTEELERRRDRLRGALVDFDGATIATVHQFCHSVLRSLGVAGATDPDAQLVEDLDELLVEVVDDLYLRTFRSQESPAFDRRTALKIARAAVNDIHADLRPKHAEPGSTRALRARFAREVRAELDLRKRRLQVMHYNDLLTQLERALEAEDSPARARMRQRWSVVLVDEFQDTDPIQWQILERAFSGHCRAMVLIGDPKQAIYGFRGGDIETYLTAAATATDRRTLPHNYRSDPGVVRALGVMLGGAALGDEQIVVHDVAPAKEGERLQGAPSTAPVRVRQVVDGVHLKGIDRPAVADVRNHVYPDLALDIAALLASGATFDGRPLGAHDVAVLAHRGKDLARAQEELHRLGIPAVTAGGTSVLQTRAAQEWLALLEAMAAPHRSVLTRGAALTDLLGYTPAEVDAGGEELDDVLAGRLRDLALVCTRQGVAAVLEHLMADGLAARLLAQVGGERTYTDVVHVAELLHRQGQTGELGLAGLLEWMRTEMAEDVPTSTSTRTRRLDSDAQAVQLLTIHGSKGLQFPVVYAPTLGDRHVYATPDLPGGNEDPPGRQRFLDVGGEGQDPEWAEAVRRHKEDEAGESLRTLYVALTRAQSQVVTWWFRSAKNTGPSGLHRMLFGRRPADALVPRTADVPRDGDATARLQEWADLGAFALEPADHAELRPVPGRPDPAELRLGAWTRRVDQDWRRTSYTALSTPREDPTVLTGGVGSEPEVVPREDEPDTPDPTLAEVQALPGLELPVPGADLPSPMAGLPVGAAFGSLVHAVLEEADPRAADLRAELLRHIEEQQVSWGLDSLDEQARGTLADALVAVCDTPLGPLAPGITLRQIGRPDRLCELDFELPLGGGDRRRSPAEEAAVLGDLVPLLRAHLPAGDPVRSWADVLEARPELAAQQLRGYLTGSVDVVLRTGGRYLVVDYKTNWLGRPDEELRLSDYRREMLDAAMGHSSYPLQALLYAVVAHRFLRWRLRGYDPSRHLGGVLYLYVRGMAGAGTPTDDGHPCGVFSWRPPAALVIAVSDLLDGRHPGKEPA